MDRPKLKKPKVHTHIKDYPTGPGYTAGHLVQKHAGWRTFRPVIDGQKCTHCLRCYLLCPDGTIYSDDKSIKVDLQFCKGCGICAYECKLKAIKMEKEQP